jgi:hypothetical protein
MATHEPVQEAPFARRIQHSVYFQLILLLLVGFVFFAHTKYTDWRAEEISQKRGITMDQWSQLVAQYGADGARKQYEAMQRTQAPSARFPKVLFFAVLIVGIYLSAKTRALIRQYEGVSDVKLKMGVDLAFTLLVFLLYALSFVLIRYRLVSEAASARWLYAPLVLTIICIAHYFYRPIRKTLRTIAQFLTKPLKRKVVTLDDLEKRGTRWRGPR